MPEIEVGGAVISLPDGASEAAIKKAIADFRSSPEFDQIVDKESGAPARVRAIVGGAPIKDRLANLRKFYPDAVEYGDDNFVFTDPASGKPTLYNPPGFDIAGDTASLAREAFQTVGGGFGAVLGTPAGPAGTAVGAGTGTAVGGTLFDIAHNLLAKRIDTRNPVERVTDTALDFAAGAVGQRAGELIEAGAKSALRTGAQAARSRLQDFGALGVSNPPAGAVSGMRAVQGAEKALEDIPASMGIMQKAREKTLGEITKAADALSNAFGPVKSKQGAGETIKAAAKGALDRFEARQEEIYTKAFDLVGPETPVKVTAVTKLRKALEGQLSRAPQSLKDKLGNAINELKRIETDAGEGGISFDALRQIRTAVGQNLKRGGANETAAQNTAMKAVYGALSEDLSAAAKAAGPEAAKALQVADRYTRMQMQRNIPLLKKILDLDADEKAFNFAMSAAKDGGSRLAKLRQNFKPEEWDTVAGTVLSRMGLAKPAGQDVTQEVFSPSTFFTNWSRMSPEAKKALFGGTRYAGMRADLERLARVTDLLKDTEKLANTSGTGRLVAYQTALGALGGGAGLAAGGDPASAGAGIAATVLAPMAAAKLLTSPGFVKWLADVGSRKAGGLAAHITRLGAVAEAEPAIREEIAQYVKALRQ